MSWWTDLFEGLQVNPVLRERLALAEQKFKDMEAENKRLAERVAALTTENEGLKRRIVEAPVAFAPPKETPSVKNGMYYRGDDGPFCTACYDTGGKLVRVADATDDEQRVIGIRRRCPVCKAKYTK